MAEPTVKEILEESYKVKAAFYQWKASQDFSDEVMLIMFGKIIAEIFAAKIQKTPIQATVSFEFWKIGVEKELRRNLEAPSNG